MHNKLIILGIETSCDETGISIYNNNKGILSEYVYTQKVHTKYGGTVPELASRDHIKRIFNILVFTLKKSNIKLNDLNGIAYTQGPGLNGPLLIGSSFSKALALSLSIPSVGINHLEAHILTSFMFFKTDYPCLVVLISGAHTILLLMKSYKNFIFLGETLDDGVGEVFDKVSRSLHLNPANGVSIEKESFCNSIFTDLKFPKSFYKSGCYNFSFSGLKTHILNIISKNKNINNIKKNISYNFQNTVIKMLINKSSLVLKKYKFKSILLSGGVSANKELRLAFSNFASSLNIKMCLAPKQYCTDNGSMVAFLGFIKLLENKIDINLSIKITSESNI